jgi:hypothetical protein
MARLSRTRNALFTLLAASAGASFADVARAACHPNKDDENQDCSCGSIGAVWNAPRGSVVVQGPSDSPISTVLTAIGEHYSHSIFSHGPTTASQSTRTANTPHIASPPVCSAPLDSVELKFGYPGAERINMAATYLQINGFDPISEHAPTAGDTSTMYYDTVDWVRWIPAECKNPKPDYATGVVSCDPIPYCELPTVSPGVSYVGCVPTAQCPSPQVIGGTIVCGPSAACTSSVQNQTQYGGHIDPTTGAFVCLGNQVTETETCVKYNIHGPGCTGLIGSPGCPDGPINGGGNCAQYKTTTTVLNRDYFFGAGLASQGEVAVPWLDDGVTSLTGEQNTGIGGKVAAFLDTAPVASVPSVYASIAPFNLSVYTDQDGRTIPYDFYQFMKIGNTNAGLIDTGEGAVCATFIAWAYNHGTGNTIPAYAGYTHADTVNGANALYSSILEECENGGLSGLKQDAFMALCDNRDPCDAAATQIVNCFATGNCDDASSVDMQRLMDDPTQIPFSISPDHLVGVGRHANPAAATDATQPVSTPWARDVGTPVTWSAAGNIYGCWD